METKFLHEYDLLPWIEVHTEAKILYYSDYYDGPMTGMLLWNGKKYWFEMYKHFDDWNAPRRYVVLEISEEDLQEEEARHQLWVECSGNYCFDFDVLSDHKPTKDIEVYYKTYPVDEAEPMTGKPVAIMNEP